MNMKQFFIVTIWTLCFSAAAFSLGHAARWDGDGPYFKTGGDGGDVNFIPGKKGGMWPFSGKPGNVNFKTPDGEDVMVITGAGDFMVNGKKVVTDYDAYAAFRGWLEHATKTTEPNGQEKKNDKSK